MTRDELRLRLDGHLANNDGAALMADLRDHAAVFGSVKQKTGFSFGKKLTILNDDDTFDIDFNAPPKPQLQTPVDYAAAAVVKNLATPADMLPAIAPALVAIGDMSSEWTGLWRSVGSACAMPDLPDKAGFLKGLETVWPDTIGPRVMDIAKDGYAGLDADAQRDVAPYLVDKYAQYDGDHAKISELHHHEQAMPGLIKKFSRTSEQAKDNPNRLRAILATAQFYSHAGFSAGQAPSLKPDDIEPTLRQLDRAGKRVSPDGRAQRQSSATEIGTKFAEMNETLAKHLVLPAYYNADVAKQGADAFTNVEGYKARALDTTKRLFWAANSAQEAVSPQRTLMALQRFERNEGILHGSLPDTNLDNVKWEKLCPEALMTPNGCTIKFLSSKAEVRETAERYHNCMAGKLQEYAYNDQHVMLITAPDGQQAAAQVKSDNEYRRLTVTEKPKMPLREGDDYVRAHQGCWVPELEDAFAQFVEQAATGDIRIDYDRIAKGTADRKAVKHSNSSNLALACGYDIENASDRDTVMNTYSQRLFSGGDYKRMGGITSYDAFLQKTGLGETARHEVSCSLLGQNGIDMTLAAKPAATPTSQLAARMGTNGGKAS